MFGGSGPIQVGLENAKAVSEAMKDLHIPVQGVSVGGAKGRRLTLVCDSGKLTVEIAGEEPIVL